MAGIEVDDGIFGPVDLADPYCSAGQHVAVVTPDRALAIQAWARVPPRWMLIRSDGHEDTTFDELPDDTSTLEPPSWVSDVMEVDGELLMVLDTSGVVPDAMAQKLLDVVTTELVRAGVGQAHVRRSSKDLAAAVVVVEALPPA